MKLLADQGQVDELDERGLELAADLVVRVLAQRREVGLGGRGVRDGLLPSRL